MFSCSNVSRLHFHASPLEKIPVAPILRPSSDTSRLASNNNTLQLAPITIPYHSLPNNNTLQLVPKTIRYNSFPLAPSTTIPYNSFPKQYLTTRSKTIPYNSLKTIPYNSLKNNTLQLAQKQYPTTRSKIIPYNICKLDNLRFRNIQISGSPKQQSCMVKVFCSVVGYCLYLVFVSFKNNTLQHC